MTTDHRARLRAELARSDAQLATLDADRLRVVDASESSNADDEHDPEGATIAFEREQLAALTDRARQRRADIDAALAALDAGTYGVCEKCGGPIGEERLQARPQARTCIACAA
jgi:DnaK suppressor protein